jgi:hypothetical protein
MHVSMICGETPIQARSASEWIPQDQRRKNTQENGNARNPHTGESRWELTRLRFGLVWSLLHFSTNPFRSNHPMNSSGHLLMGSP